MSQFSARSKRNSTSHQTRLARNRISDDDVFNYVLRVALLSYLILPRPTAAPQHQQVSDTKEKDHYARLQGAITNSFVSITDVFRAEPGSKTVKFPKELVNALESKVKSIATGMGNQDPAYSDMLFRRTMATFYGSVMNDTFKKTMKENRKIEEVILMFATHATKSLSKEPSLPGDAWKSELNKEISLFVRVLGDALKTIRFVPGELTARLDMYTAKLAPVHNTSDSGYETASTSTSQNNNSVNSSPGISFNVGDMNLVKTVAHLFKVPLVSAQREVDQLRTFCTDKAAVNDLKTCLKNINSGEPFPGRREDFQSDASWQHWRTLEMAHLSQLMLVMAQLNPSLARSTPADVLPNTSSARPGSTYSTDGGPGRHASTGSRFSVSTNPFMDHEAVGEDVRNDNEVPVGHHFVYIPPNPKKFYKRLLEMCLVTDLARMMSDDVDANEEVSLGILSPPHIELLNECALRWRIGQSYRVSCFLELVKQFYERSEVPLECIPEALQALQKVLHDQDTSKWPVHDAEYLASVYSSLFSVFLSALYHEMDHVPQIKAAEIGPFVSIIETIGGSEILSRFDLDIAQRMIDIQERIKIVSADWHDRTLQELQAAPGVNRALPLLLMTDRIEKWSMSLDKQFAEPLLGRIDVTSLFLEVVVPLFITNVEKAQKRLYESSMNGPTPDVPIQDIFSLYRRCKFLTHTYESFVPQGVLTFDIGVFFEPYVRQWLVLTDGKTQQWVEAAIQADKFEAEDVSGHSSSIVDLFDSLRSPITFLQDLEWDDKYQQARFFTSMAKTLSHAMDQYCRGIEELFMTEMFPRPTDYLQPQKPSYLMEKAKQLATNNNTSKKVIEPFNFRAESCVKLNNIEAARRLLDSMYNSMEADQHQDIIEHHGPPVPDKVEKPRFLFTIKIIMAEGLVPLDSSPSSTLDTFVTLSDEGGHRRAKTRTIYDTLSPRWDETFDVSVDKPLWLMVSIRDRALVGKHDTVGRAYLCLDPKRFGDYLTHDLWMDLDSSGRIMLRVSMEGEKDDIQFFFGRAFRSLKRAEADMIRIFIDKMSPLIQHSLSRHNLRSLLRTGVASNDYTKAFGNVTALFRSSSEHQAPPPPSERSRRPEDLTDSDIEEAISPLFDYLDANLNTLNTYLSDEAREKVMTRVWKEILTVIEGLLIPPLSDISSDMKPLTEKEVDIAFKWLKFMRDYIYAGGEGPISIEIIQNQKYRDILSIRLYYDWHTDELMEECVRMMQQTLRGAPTIKKRAKSVKAQRNLGTIKERKRDKKEEKESSNGETILRILRIRPGTSEFISQQLQIMAQMKTDQQQKLAEQKERADARKVIPPPPALPTTRPLVPGRR